MAQFKLDPLDPRQLADLDAKHFDVASRVERWKKAEQAEHVAAPDYLAYLFVHALAYARTDLAGRLGAFWGAAGITSADAAHWRDWRRFPKGRRNPGHAHAVTRRALDLVLRGTCGEPPSAYVRFLTDFLFGEDGKPGFFAPEFRENTSPQRYLEVPSAIRSLRKEVEAVPDGEGKLMFVSGFAEFGGGLEYVACRLRDEIIANAIAGITVGFVVPAAETRPELPAVSSARKLEEFLLRREPRAAEWLKVIPVDPRKTAKGRHQRVRGGGEYFGRTLRYVFTEVRRPEREPVWRLYPIGTWTADAKVNLRPVDSVSQPALFAEWEDLFVQPELERLSGRDKPTGGILREQGW